ncbi:MAG: tetratricopeptide repeat protein, partial [Bacteroidota bacterium]
PIVGEVTTVPPIILPDITPSIAEQFLPEAVAHEEQSGEFRSVITCFLSFEHLSNHKQLSALANLVLEEVSNFGAYFKEVDFGDKGGLMAIFFGAPVSYENSNIRALEFALAVREGSVKLQQEFLDFQFRMGITLGTAFTGIVGGEQRCQYACVGNRVNLAARIMTSANWGEILIDQELANTNAFITKPKGKAHYKGISQAISTFSLRGRVQNPGKPGYSGPMIAREEECEQVTSFAQPIFSGRAAGVVYIYGEAGIGKSRTTHELNNRIAQNGEQATWILCPCDQILKKPFNAYIYFLRHYFKQSRDNGPELNRANFDETLRGLSEQVEELNTSRAQRDIRELRRTQPILAALLGLPARDMLWEQLDARGRYQNTIAAITNLFLVISLTKPLVIELEDIHWMDEDSQVLSQEIIDRMEAYPIMILCTARPLDNGQVPVLFPAEEMQTRNIAELSIELGALSPHDVKQFAERNLGGPVHEEFLEVLLRATNSNPFYIEQLLEYFQENNLLIKDEEHWNLRDKSIKLSNSINSILTARIDRLSEMVRETVKAAAVIGREFDIPVLTEVLRQEFAAMGSTEDPQRILREQIAVAEQGRIWSAMNELRYIFRHSLMREAAYSMQLNARLQQLHAQIAEAIERIYADNIGEHFVDLVFHYEQAGNEEKTIIYLRKAADYAHANFQNQQALKFYDRLIAKTNNDIDATDTLRSYLNKGKVLEIIGNWEEAQQAYQQAQKLAKKSRDIILLGRTNNRLGNLLMLRGRYDEAMQYLQIAAGLFDSIDDPLGIAKVNGNLGNLFFRRAEYDKAEQYYRRSLDTGFSEMGTVSSAQTVSFLGLTYMNRGQYEKGIQIIEDQIPLHEKNNDYMGLANLHTNLGIVYFESGDYRSAQREYGKGLELAERLGNKQLQAIGTGCLGSVFEKEGRYDEAMRLFERDLKLCRQLGDWQGIAIAEGLLGELFQTTGDFEKAIPHLNQSLSISKDLGYQKGVAKAINALGDLYYWQQEFEKSVNYYNEAIEIARKTENRLVLASSLMEKGLVLLAMDQPDALLETKKEALQLAQELGNPELLLATQLLQARILAKQGDFTGAISLIQQQVNSLDTTPEQQAAAYYERFRISTADTEARDVARALYEQLYHETPKYEYRLRLERLRAAAEE